MLKQYIEKDTKNNVLNNIHLSKLSLTGTDHEGSTPKTFFLRNMKFKNGNELLNKMCLISKDLPRKM